MSNDSPIARCTVVMTKPGQRRQRVQVSILEGEGKDDVELFEQYGITSIPLSGAGGLALFFDGDRSHAAVIMPSDKRYRPEGLLPPRRTVRAKRMEQEIEALEEGTLEEEESRG